jgi:catechol 2,3-dioxygenase-like lactoylglutathione lyase family enzyme
MGREVQIAIDCADPEALASFWSEVLDYRVADPPPGFSTWLEFSSAVAAEPGKQWSRLVDPDGHGPALLFHRVPEGKVVKNRVHLDIRLAPGLPVAERRRLVEAEAARLCGLGGMHVRTDEDETDYYAVMQDPEGNEFCVG